MSPHPVPLPPRATAPGIALGLALALILASLAGCAAPQPTLYQALQADAGGYEESRLQEDMYRVSFRGNRYTAEEDVIDLLYLRCGELTLAAGFTHFAVVDSFGTLRMRLLPHDADALSGGRGMPPGPAGPYWMTSFPPGHYAPVYVAEPQFRLAMFVIRMRKGADAIPGAAPSEAGERPWLDARYLVDSLAAKKAPRPAEP